MANPFAPKPKDQTLQYDKTYLVKDQVDIDFTQMANNDWFITRNGPELILTQVTANPATMCKRLEFRNLATDTIVGDNPKIGEIVSGQLLVNELYDLAVEGMLIPSPKASTKTTGYYVLEGTL